MEKINKGEPEETTELPDLVQEEDSESLHSDQQLQKSEDKLMQQEPGKEVKTLYSLQKSEENESSLKRRRKFAADEELELDTHGSKVVQQKYGSSFALGQDSTQTNQSYAMRKECDVFAEDKLLESYGNTTVQRTDEAPESILSNLDLQVTRQDEATHQDCDRSESLKSKCEDSDRSESLKSKLEANLTKQLRERTLEESSIALMEDPTMDGRSLKPNLTEQLRERTLGESSIALMEDPTMDGRSLKPKLEANLTEQLRERTLGESSIALMEDPTMDGRSLKQIFTDKLKERTLDPLEAISIAVMEALKAEQEANGGLQQEYDRTSENDGESGSDQESENSPHVCFLTRQMEEEASPPLPSRICYHRTHTQRQRLPPVIEVPDEPLDPFEVEIALNRNRRTLGEPTGFLNYLQRVSQRDIPPESRDLFTELQWRILKLFCSLVIGAFFIAAMVLLLNYLEDKYSNQGDSNVTSPDDFSDDLSTTMADFKTDTSMICLETDATTPMVYSINFRTDFDTEVSSVLNDVDSSTNPVNDLE